MHAAKDSFFLTTLAAGRAGKIRRFINVSTDEVYGETSLGKDKGLTEQSRLEPTNPYSAAKAGAEMLALAYGSSYKLPVIVTRGNNVYGPGQFPEKLVPKFTVLASRGLQLPIHGDYCRPNNMPSGGIIRHYMGLFPMGLRTPSATSSLS
ncbi:putative Trifunctional UDP-glucose 4,6-dehydratase/UDP-4-keto-6-deoxy-D-glucose 3,5-epimerase/UDP-4-keto-L-rhamnose-reductase RHM1 [Nannochloris sp. 'desiccata']|nr:putative Trifunctional UDP-glucose 4,6-dehydratase/UDP-4-keto-6-deoxy-D-glucose 3,5-epimerase/UDP-4-keto-L-rhamnose-reductase RHM1 [Chlorella desiccata (nom. nud.)]